MTYARAVSLNSNGQIAGSVNANGGEGFLYSNGSLTSLGSFAAAAVYDNGVMVGGPSIDTGGTITNLNTLIPAGSPYQIQDATAINDNGQIVVNATYTPHRPDPRPATDPGLKPAHIAGRIVPGRLGS